ncbi:unnamed protein product [Oncorhynchus mykiss]|uniref:Uncharacterized protein n=1 Tax=Oncorhynchus mykiss TaxID=8022 RepID=A0A060Y4M5_ONCMY|nr:unnamed protein product [Oncorhynchus mykiss]
MGGMEGVEESELKKQEMLLQYLKDTESFALQVERAIAVINTMLYWKTTSVVQEAVQFCVTVCEFSVANSLTGVRKMLPLVWSTGAAIKDAVVQAYRRLYLNPQGDTTRSWSFLVVAAACSPRWFRFCGRGSLANERPPACTDEQQCCFWEWLHERRGRWSSNLDTVLWERILLKTSYWPETLITICNITDHVRPHT